VPTSAKVGIAGFFNNTKARLQKCNRAFFIVEQLSSTVPALFTPEVRVLAQSRQGAKNSRVFFSLRLSALAPLRGLLIFRNR
jgi:hypothetical protein